MEPKTVLVVEDEPMVREVLRTFLELAGVFVVETDTCARALKYLDVIRFDAVLLDNGLPDGQGVHLVPWIARRCPRVIMVTAEEERVRERALAFGAEAVLGKPVTAARLIRLLQADSVGSQ